MPVSAQAVQVILGVAQGVDAAQWHPARPRDESLFYLPKGNEMDRTSELVQLYQQSGLKDLLVTKGQRYFPEKDFSKLMFEGNDFRLSSIELYNPKREDVYFRVHYHEDAPSWLCDALKDWTGFRNANRTGTNLLGDSLTHAKALAELLSKHR